MRIYPDPQQPVSGGKRLLLRALVLYAASDNGYDDCTNL